MSGKRGMTGLHGNQRTGPRSEYIRLNCVKCSIQFQHPASFIKRHPDTRFCSHKCAGSIHVRDERFKSVQCSKCNTTFNKRVDHIRENNYCSKECSDAGRRIDGAKWRDKAQISAYNKAYREKHKERLSKLSKDWVANNKEVRLRGQAKYRKENAEKIQVHTGYRRSRIRNGDLTTEEWLDIKRSHGNCCAHCGVHERKAKLTLDHIVSLAMGGLHTKSNVQPLCQSCNSSKGIKDNETALEFALKRKKHGIEIQEV